MARKRRGINPQFGESYFNTNKEKFSRAFLSKNLRERSGILAKQFRRTQQAEKDLNVIKERLTRMRKLSVEELNNKYSKEQLIAEFGRAEKIYEQMLKTTEEIFTETYVGNIGYARGSKAETEFEKAFHDAVNVRISIGYLYKPLKKRLE